MAGNVSIPAIFKLTSGFPSVDARATPPWFAVVSLETSLPNASVLKPRTISGSAIFSCCRLSCVVVPPKEILLLTYKSPRTVRAFVVDILSLLIVPVVILAASARLVAVVAVPLEVA